MSVGKMGFQYAPHSQQTIAVRLRLSVVALFMDGDEALLLHQMTPPEPDCWDLPGGGLDPAEDLLTGLRREVAEETGILEFTVERLLTVVEGFYTLSPNTPDEDRVHSVSLIYQCRVHPRPSQFVGDPQEVEPKGIRWLSIISLRRQECSTRAWQAFRAVELMSDGG